MPTGLQKSQRSSNVDGVEFLQICRCLVRRWLSSQALSHFVPAFLQQPQSKSVAQKPQRKLSFQAHVLKYTLSCRALITCREGRSYMGPHMEKEMQACSCHGVFWQTSMNWLLLAAVELALSYFRRRAFETSGQPEHLTAFGAKSLIWC